MNVCRYWTMITLCTMSAMVPGIPFSQIAQAEQDGYVAHKTVKIDGVEIFYREAGPQHAPPVLLLHGFPSSSFMFRHLMPALADRYHIVAPDYPGFGYSSFPDAKTFQYSFEHYVQLVDAFTQALSLERYVLYIQDYGAPVGLRLALLHPKRVAGLIIQNGNAYAEGLSGAWDSLKTYWNEPTKSHRDKLRAWLNADGVRLQYISGVPEQLRARLSPDTWTLDWLLLSRPGNVEMQLDLFYDYRNNVNLYPKFQEFFRTYRPPTLIVWGKYDPFFTVAGAEAYRRDMPDAEVHLLDAGHFVLETHGPEAAELIRSFLARKILPGKE